MYFEEASVAGESPDRSEQRKSSGENDPGARDPRVAVFRASDSESGSGSESKAEAAGPEGSLDPRANVPAQDPGEAGADEEHETAPEEPGEARPVTGRDDGTATDTADTADTGAGSVAGPGDGGEPGAERAKGVTGAKSAAADEPSGDSPEAESGEEAASGSEPGQGEDAPPRDARLRAAVAAWVASAGTEGEDPESGESAGGKKEEEGSAAPEKKAEEQPKAKGVDRPTAVFNTLRSKETEQPEKSDGSEETAEPKDPKDSDAPDDSEETPKDRPTATLRRPVDRPTTTLKTLGATGDKGGDKSGAPEAGDGPENSGPKNNKDKGGDAPAAAKPGAESDSERTSQFVPLRSSDAPPAKPASAKPVPPQPAAAPNAQAPNAQASNAQAPNAQAQPPAAAGQAAGPQAMPPSERTTQQPLPSGEAPGGGQQMPLDLLAQLTNTPPPAETPVRTVVRRFKIWTPLVILLLIIFCVVQEVRPLPDATLSLGEKKAYTFGGEKFQMPWPDQGQAAAKVVGVGDIGTFGPQKPVPTASVAKAMTAHLILRNHPLKKGDKGPKITIDAQTEKGGTSQDESKVPVKEGEQYTEYQILEMLLLPSANNLAHRLARWDAQSEEAFVKKMNEESKRLGMTNTTYTDPSGLDPATKSTAVDQTKLAEEAMKDPVFREIVAMPNVLNDPKLPDKLFSTNHTLGYYGMNGIKTGSSTPAGGTLMWSAKRTIDHKERLIVGATMDQHAKGILDNSLQLVQNNSKRMVKAVADAMTSAVMVKKGDVVGTVDDGLGGKTPVVATKDLRGVGWPGLTAELAIDNGGKAVPHSAKAGTVVGELTVGTGPNRQKVPVALQKDLAEPSFGAKLTRFS
ncbi:D-alanyl-D-alanine carboxypeptidase [Streptomyces sp. NPDC050610]|uniref:D-alanyl-D-alanine carboxypeptidase n=1 Tax=Streptomyces sp. NPDC050610 TaxID=3157097 RepID=UPI00342E949D